MVPSAAQNPFLEYVTRVTIPSDNMVHGINYRVQMECRCSGIFDFREARNEPSLPSVSRSASHQVHLVHTHNSSAHLGTLRTVTSECKPVSFTSGTPGTHTLSSAHLGTLRLNDENDISKSYSFHEFTKFGTLSASSVRLYVHRNDVLSCVLRCKLRITKIHYKYNNYGQS